MQESLLGRLHDVPLRILRIVWARRDMGQSSSVGNICQDVQEVEMVSDGRMRGRGRDRGAVWAGVQDRSNIRRSNE